MTAFPLGNELPFCTPNTTIGCGQGICDSNGAFCSCFPGYEHDYTQLMFPNCFMPYAAKAALFAFLGIFSLFNAIVPFFFIFKSKGLPRKLFITVIVSGIAEAAMLLALGLGGQPNIPSLISLMILNAFGGGAAPALLTYTFLSPVLEMLRLSKLHRIARRVLIGLTIVISLLPIVLYSYALARLSLNDFRSFNIISVVVYLIIALYAFIYFVLGRYFGKWLLKEMDTILARHYRVSKGKPVNSESETVASNNLEPPTQFSEQLLLHRKKIEFVLDQFQSLTLGTVVSMVVISVLYFVLGVHPYRFVIYAIFIFPFNLSNLTLTYLAITRKAGSSNAKTENSSSKKSRDILMVNPRETDEGNE